MLCVVSVYVRGVLTVTGDLAVCFSVFCSVSVLLDNVLMVTCGLAVFCCVSVYLSGVLMVTGGQVGSSACCVMSHCL